MTKSEFLVIFSIIFSLGLILYFCFSMTNETQGHFFNERTLVDQQDGSKWIIKYSLNKHNYGWNIRPAN